MKNKIKQMFVILSMLTLLIVAFAGCELQHSHSFGNWEHNSNNHYKFCDCGETWGDGAHEFADGICSVCGYSQIKPHTHVFDQQVATEAFLKTTATCTAKATYYYSCECGEKGSDTFEGDFLHNFTSEVVEEKYLHTQATCTEKATYYKSCSLCGEKGSETFEGEPADHDFANNQACTVCNATYGLKYELNGDGESYSVKSIGTATDTEIVVPKFYNKKPITSIGYNAFEDCDSLTSVIIGNSVTSIGNNAFYYCTSLTSITIPNSVTSIGNSAFAGCRSLTSITIPDSVTSIGNLAFHGCSSLTSVTIGNSVTSIGNSAFAGCRSLTSITIPDSVTSIGNSAFSGCDSLTSITIGNSVTSIGDGVFSGCSILTSVYYMGTASEWSKISIGSYNNALKNATIYYYSETQPTESGNYWHFDTDGKTPIVWKKEN